MNPKTEPRMFTLEEYFRRERKSIERHEFYQGKIRRLSGSPPKHALINVNTSSAISLAEAVYLNPEIYGFAGDLIIEVEPQKHYTYADFTFVCGKYKTTKLFGFEILTNPSLICEILAYRHPNYDLGTKFQLYKNIESFRDYLVIDSRQIKVFHYQKINSNTWLERTYDKLEDICSIKNLDVNLSLADIYEHIEFDSK